jgi:CBS domain-containing protein
LNRKQIIMLLKEVMTPHVELISADAPLNDAAERMKALDVGVLPVNSEEGIVGIITDRDIVVRALAERRDPTQTSVSQVMTDKALSMRQDTPVKDAVASMEQQQVRRLLVVDDADQLVGLVSLGDLAVRAGEQVGGEVLQKVSDPTQPDRISPERTE